MRKGFTLVELLIVIVVIAILAAITIVSYNGIQDKARDSSQKQTVSQFMQLLEMYNIDNGYYPKLCTTSDGLSCYITTPIASETALLSPTYVGVPPTFPEVTQYVRGTDTTSYGLLISYKSGTCKTGVNVNTGWWGAATALCS